MWQVECIRTKKQSARLTSRKIAKAFQKHFKLHFVIMLNEPGKISLIQDPPHSLSKKAAMRAHQF